MMRIVLVLFFLWNITTHAQKTDEKAIQKTVETFFEGFHKGDTVMMKGVLAKDLILQTTYTNKEGKDILRKGDISKLLNAIATRPADQKWDERLLSFTIQIDGTMANAWTPYEFWLNEKFLHCGVNSFQLFKNNGTWKIIYLIDSRRKEDCKINN